MLVKQGKLSVTTDAHETSEPTQSNKQSMKKDRQYPFGDAVSTTADAASPMPQIL